MSALTSYQVLTAWLENQSGISNTKPDGLGNGASSGAWKETCRRATALVESQPMYSLIRSRLLDWVTINFPTGESFELCQCFEAELHNQLLRVPFYETTSLRMEETARTTVEHRTIDSVASELRMKPNTLRKRMDRLKTALPYGSYTDDKRKWHIHPLDVPEIKAMGEKSYEIEENEKSA